MFRATVFIPTLISPDRHFRVWHGADQMVYGSLFVTRSELEDILTREGPRWPADAIIVTPKIGLGTDQPDGETRIRGRRHEVVHNIKIVFDFTAEVAPPAAAWPHRWALKSLTPVDENGFT